MGFGAFWRVLARLAALVFLGSGNSICLVLLEDAALLGRKGIVPRDRAERRDLALAKRTRARDAALALETLGFGEDRLDGVDFLAALEALDGGVHGVEVVHADADRKLLKGIGRPRSWKDSIHWAIFFKNVFLELCLKLR